MNGDCDDFDPQIHEGAAERCNGLDDNCDSLVGAGEIDSDNDGFLACEEADDGDANSVPGATEYYADVDGDGVGAGAVRYGLVHPGAGWSTLSGDCDDNDASVSPNITVEYCDGKDNNCDGAELWSSMGLVTVDVSNIGGTVNGALSVFAHSASGVFTFEGAVQSCVLAPTANELRIGSNSIPLQAVSTPAASLASVYPICIDGSSATYWYLDADGDGTPLATSYDQAFVDCGLPPLGSGWAQLGASAEMDCDDTDASRFYVAQVGEYTDGDGDGVRGVISAQGQCIGTASTSPGADCDDTDASTTQVGTSTFVITDQGTFDRVWNTCQVADLLLDTTASLSFPPVGTSPTNFDFTVHATQSGLCSAANQGSCIGGALFVGAGDRLHLHDIDVQAVITSSGGELIAENTLFFDTTVDANDTAITLRSSGFENPTPALAFTAVSCEIDLQEVSFNGAGANGATAITTTGSILTVGALSITNWDIGIDSSLDTISGALNISDAFIPLNILESTTSITLTAIRSGAVQQTQGATTCTDCNFSTPLGYWDLMDNGGPASLDLIRPTIFNDSAPRGFQVIGFSSYLHLSGLTHFGFPSHSLVEVFGGEGLVEDVDLTTSGGELFWVDTGTLTIQDSTFNQGLGNLLFMSQNQGSLVARNLTGTGSLAFFASAEGSLELSDSTFEMANAIADSGTIRLERVRALGGWDGMASQGSNMVVDGSILLGSFQANGGSQIRIRNTTVLTTDTPLTVDASSIITVSASMFDLGTGCVLSGTGPVDWQDSWVTMADQINTAPTAPCDGLALTATGNNLFEVDTGLSNLILPDLREDNPLIAARFGELSY